MDRPAEHRTGAVAVADRRDTRDADFAAYLAARQASLLRTAYLLTGNRHDAEDLVQTAFAKLYLSWDKVRDQGSMDGYVRRILVNEHNSLWRRAWKKREHVAPDETLPSIAVDTDRMTQVLNNLVSNALRYTPDGGTITLRARTEDRGLRTEAASRFRPLCRREACSVLSPQS